MIKKTSSFWFSDIFASPVGNRIMVRGYFLRICDESTEIFVLKANNT
jgi:hypothetical protein